MLLRGQSIVSVPSHGFCVGIASPHAHAKAVGMAPETIALAAHFS